MSGIRRDVEKKLYGLLSELGDRVGAERVQQLMETAMSSAVRTKKAVDRNVDTLLSMANIPSRRDYDRMRLKIDALQGTILNLTRTVDDLRARLGLEKKPAAAGRRTAKAKAGARSTAPKRAGRAKTAVSSRA